MDKNLDDAFTELLRQLKPLVFKLSRKEDRQRIAAWTKKLNEKSGDVSWKTTRNLYANLLKMMLEKGSLDPPFNNPPPAGQLFTGTQTETESEKPYSDDETGKRAQSKRKIMYSPKKTSSLPDLSVMSSDESDDDISSMLRSGAHRPPTPTSFSIPKMFTSTPGPVRSVHFNKGHTVPPNAAQIPPTQPTAATSHTIPNYKGIVEKEVQMKERLLSNKYSEEKMKLQRHHDELLQKILDKKTREVEQFRSEYRNKVLQLENNNKTLERRVQQMQEENIRIREQKDRQAYEFKNIQAQANANVKMEWEKRIHRQEKQREEEKEKLELEHQAQLQKLLDDTTNTMSKMEEEFKNQAESMDQFLKEYEEKNSALRREIEELQTDKRNMDDKTKDMEIEISTLSTQLTQKDTKVEHLKKELQTAEKNFVEDLEQQKKSTESAAELAQQEFSYTICKAQEAHKELEQHLKNVERLKDEEITKLENKIWELESRSKTDSSKLERQCEKRLRAAEKLANKQQIDLKDEINDVKKQLRLKEKEVEGLYEAQKLQNENSETQLESLKKEMQSNTERLYREIQEQVMSLEEDLEKAAHERERLDMDNKQRLNEEKLKYDEMLAELQMDHEKEKQQIMEKYHSEISRLHRQHDNEKISLGAQHSRELSETEKKARHRQTTDLEITRSLQKQVDTLTIELDDTKSLHKKTFSDIQADLEREKKQSRAKEEKIDLAHKLELEQLRKKHTKEIEKLAEKTSLKIKSVEDEFNERLQQNSEALEKTQKQAAHYQDETKRQAIMYEKSLIKVQKEMEVAKADESQRHRGTIKALEQEVDTQRNMIRHLEKKGKMTELEMQEKVSRTKLFYEERLKGVVSNSVREELEETIAALKAQSNILEQKANILQTELKHKKTSRSPYLKAKG